jgi:hypothetical protein
MKRSMTMTMTMTMALTKRWRLSQYSCYYDSSMKMMTKSMLWRLKRFEVEEERH